MAVPGVGTGFGNLYISDNTIHGYVNTISGATSYNIWFRKSDGSATQPYTTADSNGYFFITGLTSGTQYVINYQGVNSDGIGNNMATGRTFVAQNDRSEWTLYSSSASWGNFTSGAEKWVDYDTDDCYLYRYAMTFSASGTVSIEISANFSVASYISTTTSHSGGKPTSNIASAENKGSNYTLTATVTAGTTYYLYFRGNSGRQYIGKVAIHMTAPTKVVQRPPAGKISSTSSTSNSITLVGSQVSYATYYEFAIKYGATTYYHTSTSPTYTFYSLDPNGTIPLSPDTQYTVNYRGMNEDADGSYATSVSVKTLAESSGGFVSIWNGQSWVNATPYIWNGSSWVKVTPYTWTGSSWQKTGG